MSPPIDIDGTEIQEATIDGQDVKEITIDGQQAADLGVPDSVVSLYDPNELSLSDGDPVTSFTDVVGGEDLDGGTDATYRTSVVNSQPVVKFDGVDDHLQCTRTSPVAEPYTVMLVQRVGNSKFQWTWKDTDDTHGLQARNDGSYRLDGPNNLDSSALNQGNFHLHTIIFDGGDSAYRFNGTEEISSGLATSDSLDEWNMGTNHDATNFRLAVEFGEFSIHDVDLRGTQTLSDEEQRLADKYGITL